MLNMYYQILLHLSIYEKGHMTISLIWPSVILYNSCVSIIQSFSTSVQLIFGTK